MDLFFLPKICWKAVGRNLTFAIVDSGTFLTAPASFISAGSANDYILAYLCSNVGRYYIYQNSDTTGAGDIMLNIQSLIRFPIPSDYPGIKDVCSAMIEEQDSTIQNKLNSLVYKSYGFSSKEIEYIEGI